MASSTVNTNVVNNSSITSTTAAPVTAGEMINSTSNNINNNTRHRVGATGGSRAPSSSPWTQIVRGDSSDVIATAAVVPAAVTPPLPLSSSAERDEGEESAAAGVGEEEGSEHAGNAGKRQAWNKQVAATTSSGINGGLEVGIGTVMGAVSWPALSESAAARVSGKQDLISSSSPSFLSTKGILSDGSSSSLLSSVASLSQGSGTSSLSPQKHGSHNSNLNSTPVHTVPTRQRSMKRNGVGNASSSSFSSSSSNGSASQPPGTQQTQIGEAHLNSPSHRDHTGQRNSQSRNANINNDHPQQQQRNSFRRNGGGPHMRDGSHHHSYGGRRDQDRTNQDWNNHRNFSGRDGHMQPPRVVPRVMRHPTPPATTSAPFVPPPSMRSFSGPLGFSEVATPMYYLAGPHPDALRGVPFFTVPPMYFHAPDLQLHAKLMAQIEYYFSNENLIKDTFLRQKMDDQGWVPIKLIASFKKVSNLSDNMQLILDSVRSSHVVEVQGDKVRRRNDWMRWVMPTSAQFPSVSGPSMLAVHFQGVSLEENTTTQNSGWNQMNFQSELFLGNSQSQLPSSGGTGQITIQGTSDSSTSVSSLST
ncbi:la-related protein 1C-like [Mercurialis annua]|uniref:la-related protein 1C-like n=1 Tax=Mercurialis annua TaxID=3986 RepID=UPI0021604ED7|nr:la-related protein 1C-like [Mercurialis annua]